MENQSQGQPSNQSQSKYRQQDSIGSAIHPDSILSQKQNHSSQKSQALNGSQIQRKSSTQNKNESLTQNDDQEEQNEYNDFSKSRNNQDSLNQIDHQGDQFNSQEHGDDSAQTFHQDQSKILENSEDQDLQELRDYKQMKISEEQSNKQTQIGKEENQSNFVLKQVPTEVTDIKQNDEEIQNNDKMLRTQEVMEKFKQVIKSPKTRSPQLSSEDPYQLNKPIIKPLQLCQQDSEKNSEKMIEMNLKEIYKFYSKQTQTSNKQNTFDQLHQIQQVMTLQKFMYFCKDFELIDLEIDNDFVYQHTGQVATKPLNKIKYKHKEKENFIVTKVILVEIFKKCSNIQELTQQEFLSALMKIADVIFPVDNSLRALYDYLGVYDPKIYRKKMIVVGKPFNTKDQSEILTQEKLCSRRLILPAKPKPRAESYKQEPALTNANNISVQEKPKNSAKNLQKQKEKSNYLINWEDLGNVPKEFDPKELLLEQDLSDKEDEYYLQEYLIPTIERRKKEEAVQKVQQQKLQSSNQEQQQQLEDKSSKHNQNNITIEDYSQQQVAHQQKIYKQLLHQQQTQQIQSNMQTDQSPNINTNQSSNHTPLLLSKKKNLIGARQLQESQSYSQSYKAQQIKAIKQSAKAVLNTSVEHNSPITIRKENEGLNAIKRAEAEKKQREQQIFVAFIKNQELREKKVNKK
ncbi:unnamed protein product (macronuclear) [Paramecium tetraurelia]|uniref:Uncharacterized protein n=1 Tax=Paramecium tetraurelia TaxID=5888 RepID=A0E5R8_PARTE|nr:uncharacterized protein GSPATT00003497001 [Paramecium tetraurelia]CAK90635.1 unnamed protein product [Paramecium tetraurelia]|eukprot:XP_001458032.1 hypothetical protein (macronuclear) [Paramecium tetraurelia strain d4-2]